MKGNRQGVVKTEHASRYLQQLCKHWSHKFNVEFDSTHGRIRLPAGQVNLRAFSGMLEVIIVPDDPAAVERMQSVVAEHLDRFAFREAPLPFEWRDASEGEESGLDQAIAHGN